MSNSHDKEAEQSTASSNSQFFSKKSYDVTPAAQDNTSTVELFRRLELVTQESIRMSGARYIPSLHEIDVVKKVIAAVFFTHSENSINKQGYISLYWHRAGQYQYRTNVVYWSIGDTPREVPLRLDYVAQNPISEIFKSVGFLTSSNTPPGGPGNKGLVARNPSKMFIEESSIENALRSPAPKSML